MLTAFVGPNAEGYLHLWRGQLDNPKFTQPLGFIVLLTLTWPVWFAYRKMYSRLILFFPVVAFISIFGSFGLFFMVVSVVLGIYGKYAYKQKVLAFFKKNAHLPDEKLISRIETDGGVSLEAAFIVSVIYIFFYCF